MLQECDIDTLDIFPLGSGRVPASSAALRKLSALPERRKKIFQLDQFYSQFRENKVDCRGERLSKYYCRDLSLDLSRAINFILGTLLEEYPTWFKFLQADGGAVLKNVVTGDRVFFDEETYEISDYEWGDARIVHPPVDLLDWLAMQVPCDLVLCGEEGVKALHLMSPSGWAAEWGLGKSFGEIHEAVRYRDGHPVIRHPEKMVAGLLEMNGAVERIGGTSFRSTWELNRHPENKPEDSWTWGDDQKIYFRFERQTVMPLGKYFLFTIRIYYNDLLAPHRIGPAIQALGDVSSKAPHPEFLDANASIIKLFLSNQLIRQISRSR